MNNLKINSIKANPKNPRLIKNAKYREQLKSIRDTPQMMKLRPVIIDENKIIIGGHMRWRACKELGWVEIPTESYTREEHLTTKSWLEDKISYEDLCREIAIKDNTHYGEYDFDILANEWDDLPLNEWGMAVWQNIEDIETSEVFELPDGDKAPFQQQTYTLADTQAEDIKTAIFKVKQTPEYKSCETFGNENSNGNALHLIVTQWVEQRK